MQPACPFMTALRSGVKPLLFKVVVSTPHSSSARAQSDLPLAKARCSGVSPFLPFAFSSAPQCISSRAQSAMSLYAA